MRNLTAVDPTQEQLLGHLKRTEELLAKTASTLSGRARDAEVVAMPDLGLPHNVRRIHGGFFTGGYYHWDTDVPFVPVDATVNLCGVSLFRVDMDVDSPADFRARIDEARRLVETRTRFVWNFTTGNHFVILAEVREAGPLPQGRYLVLHASPAEFKNQYNGLYPNPDNWYASKIQTTQGSDGRYLRYVAGAAAERFYSVAGMLRDYQKERQRICAELIADEVREEMLSVPHYGMPDQDSVAIGCQWLDPSNREYLLLTRPGAPLYYIRAEGGGDNAVETSHGKRLLTPHGLGVKALRDVDLRFHDQELGIAGKRLPLNASLSEQEFIRIRPFDPAETVSSLLRICPGQVLATLHQLFSYHRDSSL